MKLDKIFGLVVFWVDKLGSLYFDKYGKEVMIGVKIVIVILKDGRNVLFCSRLCLVLNYKIYKNNILLR